MLRLKGDRYKAKVDYKLEYLPDDFIVYKRKQDTGYYWIYRDGIPAKDAVTDCCSAKPLKYMPYLDNLDIWWLICSGCNYAIKANGST